MGDISRFDDVKGNTEAEWNGACSLQFRQALRTDKNQSQRTQETTILAVSVQNQQWHTPLNSNSYMRIIRQA